MDTQVRFPALQEKNILILNGRVTKISADCLEDERTGLRFFRIEIVVPPEQMAVLREVRAGGGLQAGLPSEVMIPLRKRTAPRYLVKPITRSFWKFGREH